MQFRQLCAPVPHIALQLQQQPPCHLYSCHVFTSSFHHFVISTIYIFFTLFSSLSSFIVYCFIPFFKKFLLGIFTLIKKKISRCSIYFFVAFSSYLSLCLYFSSYLSLCLAWRLNVTIFHYSVSLYISLTTSLLYKLFS